MAEIVAFPTETAAAFSGEENVDRAVEDRFLLEEGLELLADYRAIEDKQVRASLRGLVKALVRSSGQTLS